MAHRDKEVGPATEPDWRLLYEQALERAETADALVEELRLGGEGGALRGRFVEVAVRGGPPQAPGGGRGDQARAPRREGCPVP